jgi:hypothetical protein
VLWDWEYLYVLVDVNDEVLNSDAAPADSWQDDSVEFYIDGDNSKGGSTDDNDFQYRFRWNTVEEPATEYFHSPESLEGVEFVVAATDSGYLVEIGIPWMSVIGGPPAGGQLMGIDVFINDDDGGDRDSQLAWHATDGGDWSVPNRWGTAYIVPGHKASGPTPANNSLLARTWANIGWSSGNTAASHDIYFGDNFEDVNNGTGGTFFVNQAGDFILAGIPGYPSPDGLVPGTTYYWRVDEVEADGTTKYRGDVWSFTVPPREAYNPSPADGAFFIDPDVVISWEAGLGARVHNFYFGDNYADVEAGTEDTFKGALGVLRYTPGTLELGTTYYWRVDESDGAQTFPGEVLSFTTAGAGGGLRGDYYRGRDLSDLVLTSVDPQIDFLWGESEPGEGVGDDNFSVRWSGEIGAQYSETYTFSTTSDDGVRLWVGGQQVINNWADGNSEDSGTIDLVGGNSYSIVMEMYDNTGSATAQLSWESPHTPSQIIPTYVLSLPIKAGSPNPPNGSVDVSQTAILEWAAGENAASHEIYFGTDAEAVRNATSGSSEFKGTRALGSESYDPGQLQWDTTYYWRVDEINSTHPDSPWTGNLWSFTTANFLVVDNFEDYNDYSPDRIFDVWIDGYNITANGSTVGYAEPDFTAGEHFVETTIVHSGNQSMPYFYDNTTAGNSEATLTLTSLRDWTQNGVDTLTLWFVGQSSNSAELIYVVLDDSAVVYNDNADAALAAEWTEWNIDLQAFADQGVNLANVDKIGIGFGNRGNPQAGGSGLVFFDDIRLYRP